MPLIDHRLTSPRRGEMATGPTLRVEGVFADSGGDAVSVSVSVAGACVDASLERDGPQARYFVDAPISEAGCRLGVVIRARLRDGAEVALGEATFWRPAAVPARRRAAPVMIDARRVGGRIVGVARSPDGLAGIELAAGGATVSAALGPDGRFDASAPSSGVVEIWARHADPARAPTLLGALSEDGRDLAGRGDARPFSPLEAFTAALKSERRLDLLHRDGRREAAAGYRLTPAGDDWGLTVRDGAGFRTEALADLASFSASPDAPLEPLDAAGRDALKAHLARFGGPPPTLASDDLAPFGVALPVFGLRPPPARIGMIVLVRPGAFATDELYVRAPLARCGARLEIVSLDDGDDAAAAATAALDETTVVIVSRRAGPHWVARLTADPRPFIVYLMDDDPLAAFDAEGLPHRDRRRMIELAATDFAPLLRRCDRFVASSPRLAETFGSRKTVLLEPPFLRPPPSLAHLDDLSETRIVYHATDVHRDDLEFLAPALERLLKDRPDIGFELVSGFPAPGRLGRLSNFERIRPMSWTDYIAHAARRPAHISLAPTLGTPFNAAKSVVKLLDAASLGAVGVYSRMEPYAEAIRHDVDGVLVDNDPAAWRRALVDLVDRPKRLRRLALGCQAAAKERSLDAAAGIWSRLLGLDQPASG